jgi:hypothetical protein
MPKGAGAFYQSIAAKAVCCQPKAEIASSISDELAYECLKAELLLEVRKLLGQAQAAPDNPSAATPAAGDAPLAPPPSTSLQSPPHGPCSDACPPDTLANAENSHNEVAIKAFEFISDRAAASSTISQSRDILYALIEFYGKNGPFPFLQVIGNIVKLDRRLKMLLMSGTPKQQILALQAILTVISESSQAHWLFQQMASRIGTANYNINTQQQLRDNPFAFDVSKPPGGT